MEQLLDLFRSVFGRLRLAEELSEAGLRPVAKAKSKETPSEFGEPGRIQQEPLALECGVALCRERIAPTADELEGSSVPRLLTAGHGITLTMMADELRWTFSVTVADIEPASSGYKCVKR